MGETQETAREDRGGYHGVIYELRYTKTNNNYDKNIQELFISTNIFKYCSNILFDNLTIYDFTIDKNEQ